MIQHAMYNMFNTEK